MKSLNYLFGLANLLRPVNLLLVCLVLFLSSLSASTSEAQVFRLISPHSAGEWVKDCDTNGCRFRYKPSVQFSIPAQPGVPTPAPLPPNSAETIVDTTTTHSVLVGEPVVVNSFIVEGPAHVGIHQPVRSPIGFVFRPIATIFKNISSRRDARCESRTSRAGHPSSSKEVGGPVRRLLGRIFCRS